MTNKTPVVVNQSDGKLTKFEVGDTLVDVSGSPVLADPGSAVLDFIEYNQVGQSTQTISDITDTILQFNNQVTDPDSNVTTGASWKYTVPEDGTLMIRCCVTSSDATTNWFAATTVQLKSFVNGTEKHEFAYVFGGQGMSGHQVYGTDVIEVTSGQEVDVRLFNNINEADNNWGAGDATNHYITMTLLGEPESSPAIQARVLRDANNLSISNSSNTDVTWETEDIDTDGMVDLGGNSDRITIQTAGDYYVEIGVNWASNGSSSYRSHNINRFNSGDSFIEGALHLTQANQTSSERATYGKTFFNCAVGDYFKLQVNQNTGGNLNILFSTTKQVYMSVRKVE